MKAVDRGEPQTDGPSEALSGALNCFHLEKVLEDGQRREKQSLIARKERNLVKGACPRNYKKAQGARWMEKEKINSDFLAWNWDFAEIQLETKRGRS